MKWVNFNLKLSGELHQALKAKALKERRSIHNQMLIFLEEAVLKRPSQGLLEPERVLNASPGQPAPKALRATLAGGAN